MTPPEGRDARLRASDGSIKLPARWTRPVARPAAPSHGQAIGLLLAGSVLLAAAEPTPPPLHVGWASAEITPPKPVALVGQLHKRISTGVLDPLTCTALALESHPAGGESEQALLVSCDVLFIQRAVRQRIQERLRTQLPDFNPAKLQLNATHTHTGPGFVDSTFGTLYDVSNDPGS